MSAASWRRRMIFAPCSPPVRRRSICAPPVGSPSCCRSRPFPAASSRRLRSGSFHSAHDSHGTKPGPWTTASSRCFPCHPVRCSVAAARPRSRCPDKVRAYSGPLPYARRAGRNRRRAAEGASKTRRSRPKASFVGGSAYRKAFRQGATLVPRMLCLVERKSAWTTRRQSRPRPSWPAAATVRKNNRGRICPASKIRSRRNSCARHCLAKAFCLIGCFEPSRASFRSTRRAKLSTPKRRLNRGTTGCRLDAQG